MLKLFEDPTSPRREKIGHTLLQYVKAGSILNPGNGFMDTYDFTLNPYSGCSYGCNYCYAAFFSRTEVEKDNWGYWLKVKENALQLLAKLRTKPLIDKTIYISSVTDPYQPIDKELELTRKILKELLDYHNVRLVIQTRSQLVTRDIDLFKKFTAVQINMTITTDSEEVRKSFEPFCPSNKVRLQAISEVQKSGVNSCITMTPLLPIIDINEFTRSLKETGIQKFIVQPFHPEKGKYIASTREEAIRLLKQFGWDLIKYQLAVEIFKQNLPWVGEGKSGFAPI